MAKVKVPTEYELLQQELNHAINEVKIAESNFNYADAKFFDIARFRRAHFRNEYFRAVEFLTEHGFCDTDGRIVRLFGRTYAIFFR